MFAVPKYSESLEQLRKERNVEGLFQHNLVSVDADKKVATFKNLGDSGKEVKREYDFLHVVPPQKPWDWVAKSPLGRWFPTPHPTCCPCPITLPCFYGSHMVTSERLVGGFKSLIWQLRNAMQGTNASIQREQPTRLAG